MIAGDEDSGQDFGFACPWCNEANELFIDPDERGQVVVTDCRACCRPVEIALPIDPADAPQVRTEDQ